MRLAGATVGSSAAATSATASDERLAAATSSARMTRYTSRRGGDAHGILGLLTRLFGDGGCSLRGRAAEVARGQGAGEVHHSLFLLPVKRDRLPMARQPHPRVGAHRAARGEAGL